MPPPTERRRLRIALGIRQRELAEEISVSVQTVWAWEQGRSEPAGINRERYATVLSEMQKILNSRQGGMSHP
ncbi:MAG: helix-turn-helix domain-containing protein [Pseudonocardiaceae bacterium]